jgi:hypothetical protein
MITKSKRDTNLLLRGSPKGLLAMTDKDAVKILGKLLRNIKEFYLLKGEAEWV